MLSASKRSGTLEERIQHQLRLAMHEAARRWCLLEICDQQKRTPCQFAADYNTVEEKDGSYKFKQIECTANPALSIVQGPGDTLSSQIVDMAAGIYEAAKKLQEQRSKPAKPAKAPKPVQVETPTAETGAGWYFPSLSMPALPKLPELPAWPSIELPKVELPSLPGPGTVWNMLPPVVPVVTKMTAPVMKKAQQMNVGSVLSKALKGFGLAVIYPASCCKSKLTGPDGIRTFAPKHCDGLLSGQRRNRVLRK